MYNSQRMLNNRVLFFFCVFFYGCTFIYSDKTSIAPPSSKWIELSYKNEELRTVSGKRDLRIVRRIPIQGGHIYKNYLSIDDGPWTLSNSESIFILKDKKLLLWNSGMSNEIIIYEFEDFFSRDVEEGHFLMISEHNSKIIIRIDKGKKFLIFNPEINKIEKIINTDSLFTNIIFAIYNEDGLIIGNKPPFFVQDISTEEILWEKYILKFGVDFSGLVNFVKYGKKILVNVFTTHYFKNKFVVACLDIQSGELLWMKEFFEDNLIWMGVFNDILILAETGINGYTSDGNIYAIELGKGDILWEKKSVFFIPAHNNLKTEDSGYILQKSTPDKILEIDLKSGDIKKVINTPGILPYLGLYKWNNTLVYHLGSGHVNDKVEINCNGFIAINEVTGEMLWKVEDSESGCLIPFVKDGIFYYGQKLHVKNIPTFTMGEVLELNNLSPYAYAIDVETGELLWKVKLEGNEYSLVSNVVVLANKAFIRSLNGWLYEIDW